MPAAARQDVDGGDKPDHDEKNVKPLSLAMTTYKSDFLRVLDERGPARLVARLLRQVKYLMRRFSKLVVDG